MKFDFSSSLKLCLNLDRRTDRRSHASEMFRMHRLKVRRWPAFDGQRTKHARGWERPVLRAVTLSFTSMVRHAKARRAESVLIFEDDVILHDAFIERAAALEVPDDWAMLYFGCMHITPPVPCSPGLVRMTHAYSLQAIAIRDHAYDAVMKVLRPRAKNGVQAGAAPADVLLASLHQTLPCYAALPNLAWQRNSYSDIVGCTYASYSETGEQIFGIYDGNPGTFQPG